MELNEKKTRRSDLFQWKSILLYAFLFIFFGCSFSPWETPGTISGKNAKSELNKILYLHTLATNAIATSSGYDLNSKSYRTACGRSPILRSFYVGIPGTIKDNKLYKKESVQDCKHKINLYAAMVLGYAFNEDGCIFTKTITTMGKYDCHLEEADTLQIGNNGIF